MCRNNYERPTTFREIEVYYSPSYSLISLALDGLNSELEQEVEIGNGIYMNSSLIAMRSTEQTKY
jgi:hypothetical protein